VAKRACRGWRRSGAGCDAERPAGFAEWAVRPNNKSSAGNPQRHCAMKASEGPRHARGNGGRGAPGRRHRAHAAEFRVVRASLPAPPRARGRSAAAAPSTAPHSRPAARRTQRRKTSAALAASFRRCAPQQRAAAHGDGATPRRGARARDGCALVNIAAFVPTGVHAWRKMRKARPKAHLSKSTELRYCASPCTS